MKMSTLLKGNRRCVFCILLETCTLHVMRNFFYPRLWCYQLCSCENDSG